jgi:hypothetical protein
VSRVLEREGADPRGDGAWARATFATLRAVSPTRSARDVVPRQDVVSSPLSSQPLRRGLADELQGSGDALCKDVVSSQRNATVMRAAVSPTSCKVTLAGLQRGAAAPSLAADLAVEVSQLEMT